LGFAWDPWKNGKTAIRGGYGLAYDTILVGILEQNIFGNPPFVNNVTISNTILTNPASVAPSISALPKTIRGSPFDSSMPYVQQWSFDVQREIAHIANLQRTARTEGPLDSEIPLLQIRLPNVRIHRGTAAGPQARERH